MRRWLIETAIAVPIVIVTILALGALNYLVGWLSPGKTLRPDAVTNMALASPRFVYPVLLLSFTLAPVAEEFFFRGFLYNAFRQRMPAIAAGILQSLIFGFCHTFGTIHAVIAVVLGIALTLVYQWRKTLVTPIVVHAGLNLTSAIGVLAMMAQSADRPVIGVNGGPHDVGCVVRQITPHSAASESDIKLGDRIVAFEGQPVATFGELAALVASRRPYETVTLTIDRVGESLEIRVTLKRRGDAPQPP
jgi:membrane protease YdiL (CAAX protease family)